mgnify:CR=1 FL=1
MKKKDNLLFDESRGEWYKKDWDEYDPPIIRLVPSNSYVLDCVCGKGGLLTYLRMNYLKTKKGGKLTHFQMEVIFDQKLFIVQRLMYLREKISNKMRR